MQNLHDADFYDGIRLGKKTIQGRFVIPSGIRCAHAAAIERYFRCAAIGIITTKSISIAPKQGYREPLYVKYGENSYMNAVGLENPGAEVFAQQLAEITIPENKFLLVSLCGSDADSFYQAAQILASYADGFELNLSCPHAKGYGLQIGSDIALVAQITKKVAENCDVPVFAKLSATIPEVAKTAQAAIANGAVGIVMTNTVGPGLEYIDNQPLLSNGVGGLSGDAIRPLGLKALRDIRQVIGAEPIVIGMGGIFSADHVKSYHVAGANFFGIGSALTNLTTPEAERYLDSLQEELIRPDGAINYQLPPVTNMDYQRCIVEKNEALTDVLHKITISPWKDCEKTDNVAGKFFFLMIPGVGEKPFALFSLEHREFIIKNVGCFTNILTKLAPGDAVYLRGPYGNGVPNYQNITVNFVAGGTGISPVYEIAKRYSKTCKVRFFLGGKIKGDLFDLERYAALGSVCAATEDGSVGAQGFVTDLLSGYAFEKDETQAFINVGPKVMLEKCEAIERNIASEDNIWTSIEYQTCCGVGICGKCATPAGLLSCVDGPFLIMQK